MSHVYRQPTNYRPRRLLTPTLITSVPEGDGTITIIGTPETGSGGNGADVTLTFNEAPIEDDLVLLVGGNSDSTGVDPIGPSTAGYTQDSLEHTDSHPYGHGVWYKFMTSTPDTTVVCQGTGDGTDSASYIALVLRGVDLSTPIDTATIETGPTFAADPDLDAIVTATVNAWVVVTVGGNSSDGSIVHPSGYINTALVLGVDTNRSSTSVGTKEIASPSSEDPGAYALWTNHDWTGFTVAIRPAGGGGPAPVIPERARVGVGL